MKKIFQLILLFVLFVHLKAQNTCFQKVYNFGHTLGIISFIKQVDSHYILGEGRY